MTETVPVPPPATLRHFGFDCDPAGLAAAPPLVRWSVRWLSPTFEVTAGPCGVTMRGELGPLATDALTVAASRLVFLAGGIADLMRRYPLAVVQDRLQAVSGCE